MLDPIGGIPVSPAPVTAAPAGPRFGAPSMSSYLDRMRPATAIVVLVLLALIGVAFTVWWFWLQSPPV
jgi:hypothetical protein